MCLLYPVCQKSYKFLPLILLVFSLTGCGGTAKSTQSARKSSSAERNYLSQAEQQLKIAYSASPSDAQRYRLAAAESYLNAKSPHQAQAILYETHTPGVGSELHSYKTILLAEAALQTNQARQAQKYIDQIWSPISLSSQLQEKYFKLRAQAQTRLGNVIAATQTRIELNQVLDNDQEIQQNSQATWEELSQLTPDTLRTLKQDEQVDKKQEMQGWLEYTHISKQYDNSSEQLIRALRVWQERYPNHPANKLLPNLEASVAKQNQSVQINPPKRIALLLPLQGKYQKSAQAIRDGFLTAIYHIPSTKRPTVTVIDTQQSGGVIKAYQQALNAQAEIIVGPLIKENIRKLAKQPHLAMPVLALNTIPGNSAQLHQLYQFGLAPEHEAETVAQYALRQGYKNAAIIVPKSTWGNRLKDSFIHEWKMLGGQILHIEQIATQSQLGDHIKKLLAIEKSERRAKQLNELGIKFNTEPKRRKDIDFVFMAASPTIARQLKPLFNFYYATDLPILANSSIHSAKSQLGKDNDLNGIEFCDVPWMLDPTIKARKSYRAIVNLWPNEFEENPRLYALGVDAFKIANQLHHLELYPELAISGMTGMLKIAANKQIKRQLTWASFNKGKVKLTAS